MSVRPAESVNRAAEQMRRTPAAAAGREEGACEGAGEDEERAEGGADCAVHGAGHTLYPSARLPLPAGRDRASRIVFAGRDLEETRVASILDSFLRR